MTTPESATPKRTGPAQIPPAEVPGVQGLLTLAVGVVCVTSLYLAREVLVPITLAVLLSFVLAPLVAALRRINLPRLPAVLLAVILALGVILSLGGLIGMQVAQLSGDIPRYAATVEDKAATLRAMTLGRLAELAGRISENFAPAVPQTPASAQTAPEGGGEKPLPVEVRQPPPSPLDLAARYLSPVLGPLGTLGIVLVVSIFILLQREDLRDRLIRLFGSGDLHRTTAALDDAGRRLSKYFLAQLALNSAFGVIIAVGLFLIGVPSPVLWGIFAGLSRFVPYIGSVMAAIGPLALAAGGEPGWTMAVETGLLFVVAEPVMGQVVEPLTYGHSTGLSPISVVLSAIFWGWLWGPIGLILSMPLTLCLVVMGRHIKRLEFIDVLLGDRPALTPIESFYQRMLTGDPDEATDYAEILLKSRALSSYYDEVAVRGLQLAAGDAERGVLSAEQIARIAKAAAELIEELAEHDDRDPPPDLRDSDAAGSTAAERALPSRPPPRGVAAETLPTPWQADNAVLCIAGRGPLDDAPAAMLAQLLGKHGFGARILPHDSVGRSGIGALEATGVAMVCLTYLDVGAAPSGIRYVVRRLRQRLPGVRVAVALWPAELAGESPVEDMLRLQAAIGADEYPASLREAVEACTRFAQAGAQEAAPAPEAVSAT